MMPRYFFNVVNGTPSIDKSGVELPDPATARREALKLATDVVRLESGMTGRSVGATIVVADENGQEVLAVTVPKPGPLASRRDEDDVF